MKYCLLIAIISQRDACRCEESVFLDEAISSLAGDCFVAFLRFRSGLLLATTCKVVCRYLRALAQMVMARLETIRRIVRVRRSQRRESGNEVTAEMDREEALMCRTLFMVYLLVFEDVIGVFRYLHDGTIRNGYTPASFQTLYNSLRPLKEVTVTFITARPGSAPQSDSHLSCFH